MFSCLLLDARVDVVLKRFGRVPPRSISMEHALQIENVLTFSDTWQKCQTGEAILTACGEIVSDVLCHLIGSSDRPL